MASPFDVFNRPLTVRRTTGAASGHFNSNDVYAAPTTTSVVIQGHISIVNVQARESQYGQTPSGQMEKGNPRLFTETLLEKGDIIEMDQGNGVTFSYRVIGMVQAHRIMAQKLGTPVRYQYDLAEIPR